MNNELKPLEIRTSLLTQHFTHCRASALHERATTRATKALHKLHYQKSTKEDAYRVCLFRILELNKCEAPEMKENKHNKLREYPSVNFRDLSHANRTSKEQLYDQHLKKLYEAIQFWFVHNRILKKMFTFAKYQS